MRKSAHGFTLVELLVIISIIAILSVIGITIFTGIQNGARDARRRNDINEIAKVMEVNRTASGYQSLTDNQFSGGIPQDPENALYCINGTLGASDPDPAPWGAGGCPGGNWGTVGQLNFPPANSPRFKVCSILKTGSSPVFCLNSSQ